jgi:hypothetical protein
VSIGAANPPNPPKGMVCVGYRPVTGDLKDAAGRPFLRYHYAPAKQPPEPRARAGAGKAPKSPNAGSM